MSYINNGSVSKLTKNRLKKLLDLWKTKSYTKFMKWRNLYDVYKFWRVRQDITNKAS